MDRRQQLLNLALFAFSVGYLVGELITKVQHASDDAKLAKHVAAFAAVSRLAPPAQPEKEIKT